MYGMIHRPATPRALPARLKGMAGDPARLGQARRHGRQAFAPFWQGVLIGVAAPSGEARVPGGAGPGGASLALTGVGAT